MKRKIGFVLGGLLWFVLVFLIGLRLTFPSGTVAERVSYEVERASGGTLAMQLGSVLPAWKGVRLDDLTLFQVDPGAGSEDGAAGTPIIHFDAIKARTTPLGWLRGSPRLYGTAWMGSGGIDFDLALRADDKGAYLPSRVLVDADGFPLSAMPSIAGAKMLGTGGLDLDIDLDAADGLGKAAGTFSLTGADLMIDKLAAPGTPLEGFELGQIPVSEVDLAFEVTQGRARVRRGTLRSDLADAEIDGDILLHDDPSRIRFRLKVVFSLGDQLQMFQSFLKDAEWSDGRYHYSLTGTVSRPRFRPERERRGGGRTVDRGLDDEATGGPAVLRGAGANVGLSDEDLEARREERRKRREERIRERRERLESRAEDGEEDGPSSVRGVRPRSIHGARNPDPVALEPHSPRGPDPNSEDFVPLDDREEEEEEEDEYEPSYPDEDLLDDPLAVPEGGPVPLGDDEYYE